MTHKDFVLIASVIASMNTATRDREAIARDFADALRRTNPAFNGDRFIAAATGKPYSRRDVQR